MLIDDIDSEHLRFRKELGKTRGDLSRAAARVEDMRLLRNLVTPDQRNFLRPNRASLCIKSANHRLVRHLFGLRVKVRHRAIPSSTMLMSFQTIQCLFNSVAP